MKVLQMVPSLEVGGVERGVIDIARGMKKRGHQTVVISSGGALTSELQKMEVTHYALPIHQKSVFTLSLVPKITEIIRRENIDIIHPRSRVPAWLGWLAACRTGKPFMTSCHGYYSRHGLSRVMGWGKRVIVISNVIARHMIDHFDVPPERIRLIHRGLDLSQFPFNASRYDEKPGTYRIINVGRLSPIKGQLEFLKAVHRLRHQLPSIEVWLVGSEAKGKTKYTRRIEDMIRQLKLESCVKLLGTRRDIPELLAQADLLVLSTLVPEAFGRVVIEAGAVGTAVLATRVGGVLEIIEHGKNGLLVPAGDTEGMAEAMADILRDRGRSKQFAARLREKVEKEFTLDQMVEQTLNVYQEVLREKKILMMKLGAAGDLILGTPSFRMIHQRFPQAEISLLVDKKLAALVSACPYIHEVIAVRRDKLSRPLFFLKLAKRLRREKFDLSVDLQNSKWTHLLSALAAVPERYGFYRGKFGFLLNRPDRSFDVTDTPIKHQYRILSKLGVKKLDETLELWPDPDSEARMETLIPGNLEERECKWVGLAVGSSEKWPSKRWPAEYFTQLAEMLVKAGQCRVIFIGSDHDIVSASLPAEDSSGGKILNWIGKTSWQDLVSLMKRLDVLVTGDTAPLHVAAAMKTKIVALFGPTDPRRHMPPAPGATVLTRRLPCQPCYKGECVIEDKMACLKRISVEEVFQAVKKYLTLPERVAAVSP